MQERRGAVRRKCRLLAQYRILEDPTLHTARLSNFSSNGACFTVSQNIPLGSPVAISFVLSGEDGPLLVKGIVRWFSKVTKRRCIFRYGVEFFDLDETSFFRLDSNISKSLKKPNKNVFHTLREAFPFNTTRQFLFFLGVFLLSAIFVWVFMLRKFSLQLSARLNEQSHMVNILKSDQKFLNARLEEAQQKLDTSYEAVLQLESERSSLENEIVRLSSSLDQVSDSYLRLRAERKDLQLRLSQLEAEQLRLNESIRLMSAEGIVSRGKYASNQSQEQNLEDLSQGNRGFLILRGRSTSTGPKLSIRVYDPEEKLAGTP